MRRRFDVKWTTVEGLRSFKTAQTICARHKAETWYGHQSSCCASGSTLNNTKEIHQIVPSMTVKAFAHLSGTWCLERMTKGRQVTACCKQSILLISRRKESRNHTTVGADNASQVRLLRVRFTCCGQVAEKVRCENAVVTKLSHYPRSLAQRSQTAVKPIGLHQQGALLRYRLQCLSPHARRRVYFLAPS